LGVWEGHHGVSARMSCSREKISRFAASRQVLVACSERELGAMRRKWAARLELLQNFDQRRHIVGQFAFEAKLGAGDWVFEAEHSRMQRLARKRGDGGRGFLRVRTFRFEGALLAVKRIADQRAA